MMSVPLSIEIVDKKKKKEVLKVEVREFTKTERKENKSMADKYKSLATRLNKIQLKMNSVTKRRDYAEKLENFKDADGYQVKIDTLTDELENIMKEIDTLGGDEFAETQAEKNFETLVSGEGKERLAEIADIKGYVHVTNLLYKERDKVEGKQHEE